MDVCSFTTTWCMVERCMVEWYCDCMVFSVHNHFRAYG